METQKAVLLIVGVLVAGLLIGGVFSGNALSGQAVRKPIIGGEEPSPTTCAIQLTTSGQARVPSIEGDNIIWFEYSQFGQDWRAIYRYRISTKQKELIKSILTNPFLDDSSIRHQGNKVIFTLLNTVTDRPEVYYYDLITGFFGDIPTIFGQEILNREEFPKIGIYGDNIVFHADNGTHNNLYSYDTRTNQLKKETIGEYPSIYGTNVTYSNNFRSIRVININTGISKGIYLSHFKSFVFSEEVELPEINKNTIAFVIRNNTLSGPESSTIITKNGIIIDRIKNDPWIGGDQILDLDEPWITWVEGTGTSKHLFVYNYQNKVKKEITSGSAGTNFFPDISNNKLVYRSSSNIYLYDLAACPD